MIKNLNFLAHQFIKITAAIIFLILPSCIDEGEIDKKIEEQIPVVLDECREMCVNIMDNDFPYMMDQVKDDLVDDFTVDIENRFFDYMIDSQCVTKEQVMCIINETWMIYTNQLDPEDFGCF